MKKQFLLFLILLTGACTGVQKSTQTTEANNPAETKNVGTPEKAKEDPQRKPGNEGVFMSRLLVSFYSTGGGSDFKTIDTFESFLLNYETPDKAKLTFDKIPWGREGEVDFCMGLENMNSEAQSKFVMVVKELLIQTQLVHIAENAPCKHKL